MYGECTNVYGTSTDVHGSCTYAFLVVYASFVSSLLLIMTTCVHISEWSKISDNTFKENNLSTAALASADNKHLISILVDLHHKQSRDISALSDNVDKLISSRLGIICGQLILQRQLQKLWEDCHILY